MGNEIDTQIAELLKAKTYYMKKQVKELDLAKENKNYEETLRLIVEYSQYTCDFDDKYFPLLHLKELINSVK